MIEFKNKILIILFVVISIIGFKVIVKITAEKQSLDELTSNGFDYPVGTVNAGGWYNAQDFGVNSHLGEDWNISTGGNNDCGLPVYAASEGTIVYAQNAGTGWENVIIVRHQLSNGAQVETLYGHLSTITRTSGVVSRREQIGTVGKDYPSGQGPYGISYCHLHFELRYPNSRNWGTPGPGYSSNRTGWTDPSNYIDANRTLGCSISIGQGTGGSEFTAFQNAYNTGGGQSILGCATANVRFDGFTSFAGTISHYQTTSGGDIEYHTNGSRAGQAFAMITPFLNKWASFGYSSNNPLGYPIGFTSQPATSCYATQNRFQSFEGGSLSQHLSGSRNGQLFEVHGAIHRRWELGGFAVCPLGLPTSDETTAQPSGATGSAGKLNQFEGGQIYWKANASEAYQIHGAIYNTYVNLGGSASWLGFPTSNEFISNGYPRSNFEGGYITTTNGVNYQAYSYTSCPSSPSLNPSSGQVGAQVIITGNNFTGVTSVRFFNNVSAQFTVNNNTQITATVPNGAATGVIIIGKTGCSNLQTQNFTVTNNPPVSNPVKFDFDGDRKADVAIYRPSDGIWHVLNSQSGYTAFRFGLSTDKIVPADYDGDGKTDYAVYRPSNGIWYIQRSSQGFASYQFGLSNDIPISADFDGDGKADVGIYRPSNGRWYILRSSLGYVEIQFGLNGDKPVSSDYDRDGKADIAVYRPSNGRWYVQRSSAGYIEFQFGNNEDKVAMADYDGDGQTDLAVYRPSNGRWYIQRSSAGYTEFQFGLSNDKPSPADYDGDGKADIAVYRPSNGVWYIQRSNLGFTAYNFGTNTDLSVASAFVY